MRKVLTLLFISFLAFPQFESPFPDAFDNDDLQVGGDIFNDFNEDLETEQVLEDERFFAYGRYYAINIGLGYTTFSGSRGEAYDDELPSFNFGMLTFVNFQLAYVLGVAVSQHSMFFDRNDLEGFTTGLASDPNVGFVDITAMRFYLGFRYYLDTSDLGTALTYSNPYFTMRAEYWRVTNKFEDLEDQEDDTGGGVGGSMGWGLEFPIELKESYVNFEFLLHAVNFHDRFTNKYRPVYSDLDGYGYTYFLNYVISW